MKDIRSVNSDSDSDSIFRRTLLGYYAEQVNTSREKVYLHCTIPIYIPI